MVVQRTDDGRRLRRERVRAGRGHHLGAQLHVAQLAAHERHVDGVAARRWRRGAPAERPQAPSRPLLPVLRETRLGKRRPAPGRHRAVRPRPRTAASGARLRALAGPPTSPRTRRAFPHHMRRWRVQRRLFARQAPPGGAGVLHKRRAVLLEPRPGRARAENRLQRESDSHL